MKPLFYIAFVFILISCGDKKKQEVLDLNDVLPSSERYKEGDTANNSDATELYYDTLSNTAKNIADTLGFLDISIDSIPETWLADRFPKLTAEKWQGQVEEKAAKAAVYKFRDSLAMKTTLFNWLDCFGEKCASLLLFEEKKLSSRAFVLFATEKELIYFETEGEMYSKEVLANLSRLIGNKKSLYVITQERVQKTQWWIKDKAKWVIIENEEL